MQCTSDNSQVKEINAELLDVNSEDAAILVDFDKEKGITQALVDEVRENLGSQKPKKRAEKAAEKVQQVGSDEDEDAPACKRAQVDENDSESEGPTTPKMAKATKTESKGRGKGKAGLAEKESNMEGPNITAYIQILKNPAPTTSRGSKKSSAPQYTSRGPIFLTYNTGYHTFLDMMATALPCPVTNIVQGSLYYRTQSPANSPLLPVGSPEAYLAMMMLLKGKRNQSGPHGVFIIMDKPMKPATNAADWDMGDGEPAPASFDFTSVETNGTSTSLSISAQKVSFDDANMPFLQELFKEYPVNNSPLYPGLHVYTNSVGTSWELNDTRLSVWATNMARKVDGVDHQTPPRSSWFDFKHRLKPLKTTTTPAPELVITPPPPTPASAPALAPTPAPPATSNDLHSCFMDFVMMLMMQNHITQGHSFPIFGFSGPTYHSLGLLPDQMIRRSSADCVSDSDGG
ncbi:hypothetical protein K435DRAFT_792661 [Dendrothele bispora CBS 962.96]|uniref:Uncharacterized protein n=1 Tax=Dendrothele bispora (strain CBS 962.96) TaxID=1314807 RepID=A0A4S8MHY0_DENBC|nr:hypothetical protein K435DRAFT_792661 [Dendrothele bispora CBS 962.96]